jgi:acyl-CoA reductase-like NAD-dependent aldehyde dehydrogenase
MASSAERTAVLAREAQGRWAARPVPARLSVIRQLRHRIAGSAGDLAMSAAGAGNRPTAEVLTSEVLPLADACRFLEREAGRLLAPRRLNDDGRPFWMRGVAIEVRREPLGLVLVIAPANYPLFLPGVQTVQALAAGNAVLWKPGRSGSGAAHAFASLLAAAGLPEQLLTVLPEGEEAGREAIAAGPDKVLLTGSAATGQAVLAQLAPRLIPAALELSGCDAVFVLPGCDNAGLDRVARALRFGLELNGGATCIAPRRVFVPRALRPGLEERLVRLLGGLPASPTLSLLEVGDMEEALAAAALSPYALGAAVFGPEEEAVAFAGRVRAGVVVVNDVIVPTADPRLPFGGRGTSGYGSTRGALGLLELTAVKAVAVRRGAWLPHLDARQPGDEELFRSYLALVHGGGFAARLSGLAGIVRAIRRRPRGKVSRTPQSTALPQEGMS